MQFFLIGFFRFIPLNQIKTSCCKQMHHNMLTDYIDRKGLAYTKQKTGYPQVRLDNQTPYSIFLHMV